MISFSYLAGFFDGEGCVSIVRNRNRYSARIMIVQRKYHILYSIQDKMGFGRVHIGKTGFCYWIASNRMDVRIFLMKVRKYVVVKKDQCELMLDFLRNEHRLSIPDKEEIFRKISQMKRIFP